nr:MAG TPA: hypothetical protein [Caudoviricetes sp.]
MTRCPWRLNGERCAGSSPGQGTGSRAWCL